MKNLYALTLLLLFPACLLAPVSDFSRTVNLIENACMKFNYNMSRAFALILSENDFKNITTYQKSKNRHYYGAVQICYETAKIPGLHFKETEKDLEKPEVSIPLAIHYMKILEKQHKGNFEKIVAHYSGYVGHSNREKHYKKMKRLLADIEGCL